MEKLKKKTNYQKATELILKFIVDKGYLVGDKLPSQDSFSEILKIGRISIQQAVRILEKEGVLSTVKGSGCYLKALPLTRTKPHEDNVPSTDGFSPYNSSKYEKVIIKIALSSYEIKDFGGQWKKIFIEYQKRDTAVAIEMVEVKDLEDWKRKLRGGETDILQIPLSDLPFYVDSNYLFPPEKAGKLEIIRDDFFKQFLDASFCRGITWGVPLAVNSTCLYYNKSHENSIHGIFPVTGFWNFLDRLEKAGDKTLGAAEAFIANDYIISGFLANCPGELKPEDFSTCNYIDSPDFANFATKFQRYYMNGKIFHPGVREVNEEPFLNFIKGRSTMTFGNSSWIPKLQRAGFKSWGIMPEPVEKGGYPRLSGMLNVISAFSYHPAECLDVINFLAQYDVQKSFAARGRIVAHEKACRHLKIEGLDSTSRENLLQSFVVGKVLNKKNLNEDDFTWRVLLPEMIKWHCDNYSAQEFCRVLRMKKRFFSDAMKSRMEFTADSSGMQVKTAVNR